MRRQRGTRAPSPGSVEYNLLQVGVQVGIPVGEIIRNLAQPVGGKSLTKNPERQ